MSTLYGPDWNQLLRLLLTAAAELAAGCIDGVAFSVAEVNVDTAIFKCLAKCTLSGQ
jgi:hypothetical protein